MRRSGAAAFLFSGDPPRSRRRRRRRGFGPTVRPSTAGEPAAIVVPITTLAPEPFVLLRDVPAVVHSVGDSFVARFFDANIGTSGDTQQEAVTNLKSLMMDIFEDLEAEQPERLGPEPSRQLAVLRAFIRRTA
mgnify:FL=1